MMNKTPTKTSEAAKAVAEVPGRVPMFDPWARMSRSDWFDRWPEMFQRRWPESFRGIPFGDDGFRMEQFVDEDGTLVVRGELPGLDIDNDVTITVDDNRLTIVGKREDRTEKSTDGTYRSEFHYGSFQRSLTLPPGAMAQDVTATYTDGILEVRVPVDVETPSVTSVPIVKKS
jgi:HSP20 family protein